MHYINKSLTFSNLEVTIRKKFAILKKEKVNGNQGDMEVIMARTVAIGIQDFGDLIRKNFKYEHG